MNGPKNTGTAHETAIKKYLIARGYPQAKRIVLHGNEDEGDLSLGDGYPVVIEAKGGRGAITRIPKALAELEVEITNAGAEFGFVVAKRTGTTNVGRYYAVVEMDRMMDIVERVWPKPKPLGKPRVKRWPTVR